MARTLEPKGKLDATDVVNGPEDGPWRWESVSWLPAEENVRRLRQRIFTASQAGDLKRVRNLQKLMLRSRSSTLVSVRRVTEINAGRKTAGIDGEVALTPGAKADLAGWVQHRAEPWPARPVKRVYIPKRGSAGKQRPLGIPVIAGRALQAVAANALEPEWEARFEPRSYGFRPGRGCHDAIEAIFQAGKGGGGAAPRRPWVLDADLAAAFDRIGHDHILRQLGAFPARGLIAGWLRAGVAENGRVTPSREGTPQGGVISPLLLNVALHGMESAAGAGYRHVGSDAAVTVAGCPVLVRYADDLVAFCHTRQEVEQVKAQLAAWLAPRGLAFNEDKTRTVTLDEGFDFLGCTIRRYHGKLLIKPSKAAITAGPGLYPVAQSLVHQCLSRPMVANSSRRPAAWTPSARSPALIAMSSGSAAW
jgi:RNA-directed DNA polymerase